MNSRLLVVALLLCLASAEAGVPKASKPETSSLPTPAYLPPLARAILHKRMQRHGRDQSRLVIAVTLLQRDVVNSIASDLAAEPRLVRPAPDARDELNSALPERFFVLQDALRSRSLELANAAKKGDDAALAKSFGGLVEICVSCHSAYLTPE